MERSKLGLVVVDFWAEWCAPCRMLGPVLEKLASESDGKFTLVKAETEQNTDFGTIGGGFLDFTENNPFGDPENN